MERDGGISEPQQIMKTKRIIIYGRVSTAEQRHDSQIAEVQDYCARRWGNNVGVTTITDTASGAKTSREGLDHLMQLVRRNKVDVVACFKLDRLGARFRTWRKSSASWINTTSRLWRRLRASTRTRIRPLAVCRCMF